MMRFRPKNIPNSNGFHSKASPQGLSRYFRPIEYNNNVRGRITLSPSPFLVNKRAFTNSCSVFNKNKDEFNVTPSLHSNQSKNNQDSHPFNEATSHNTTNNTPQQSLNENNNTNNSNNPIPKNINDITKSNTNNISKENTPPLAADATSKPDRIIDLPPSNTSNNNNNNNIDSANNANALKQQRNILRQANQNISATLHYAGQSIEELENMLMKRLNENNKRRFRMYFFGSFSLLIVLLYVFGGDIRKMVSAQTADLAKETLENESLQIQTQQLAMAVVQTILNDPDVTAMAASFLKEASTAQETQLALLELVTHVLQHPQSLQELTKLSEQLLQKLTQEPQVQQQLVTLLNRVLMDEQFQVVLVQVLQALFQHPEIVLAMTQCFAQVFQQPEVQVATQQLVTSAAQELLADEQVMEESRRFIADVMGDDSLQKEGGDALWNSLNYALKPGFIKITGVMLIGLSIGAFRLFISPF